MSRTLTLVVGPSPALMATLSSPVRMKEWVMVMLRDCAGSMPSVLRAVLGVSILTAQTVRPSPRWKERWKLGEFLRVMR